MSFRRLLSLPRAASLACAFLPLLASGRELLTLESAQRLSVDDQPLIEARAATIDAQRARAVAAGQLPDPELQFGVSELPANTTDAWSFRRDGDTDIMIAVMQEYPRAAKRRLRRMREEADANRSGEELRDLTRVIRRDAGLEYMDVYYNQRAQEIVEAQLAQAQLQHEAARIRFTAGTAAQSELLAAAVEAAALRDKLAGHRQMLAHERLELSRWIGPRANDEVARTLPALPAPPAIERTLEGIATHPSLLARERATELAGYSLDLARQEYKPDWRLELGYGYRPGFSEMLTLRVAVDLPLFTRNRQDREAAAARHDIRAAAAQRANRRRELATEASLAHHDWRLYEERLEKYRQDALPAARSRLDAAHAAYRAGSGTLADALLARRALLDVELQLLTLGVEAMRSRIELDYFLEQGDRP